jgi:hypothetical protein
MIRKLLLMYFMLISCFLCGQTRPSWYQLKDKPTIFVADYGAHPNDSIDDSPAIQAAINAALRQPSATVEFGSGLYIINTPINVTKRGYAHLRICGQGMGTQLRCVSDGFIISGGVVPLVLYNERILNVEVSGLTMTGTPYNGTAIDVNGFSLLYIANCRLTWFDTAIHLTNGSEYWVSSLSVQSNNRGIVLTRDTSLGSNADLAAGTIKDCVLTNRNTDVLLENAREAILDNCLISLSTEIGGICASGSTDLLTINKCHLETRNNVPAVYVATDSFVAQLELSSCYLSASTKDCILIDGTVRSLSVTNSVYPAEDYPIVTIRNETAIPKISYRGNYPEFLAMFTQLGVGTTLSEVNLVDLPNIQSNDYFNYGLANFTASSPAGLIATISGDINYPNCLLFPTPIGWVYDYVEFTNFAKSSENDEVWVDVIADKAFFQTHGMRATILTASGAVEVALTYRRVVSSDATKERVLGYYKVTKDKFLSVRIKNTSATIPFKVYSCKVYTNIEPEFSFLRSPTIPSTGTHSQGQIVYNSVATSSADVGWICTVAGSPGTWKSMGTIP